MHRRISRGSGLSLDRCALLIVLGGACATPEEADPFQPPQRPLIMPSGQGPCSETPRARRARDLPPTGLLPPKKKLPLLVGTLADGAVVVVHGGVGSPPSLSDGPETAAKRALERLAEHEAPLDAAVRAVTAMEDDGRFNAGSGANIRLDGKSIQMDASLMTGEGLFAAVAGIERVKNPILVARRVLETPHILLAGDGATRFAHQLGFKDEVIRSKEAEAKFAERIEKLRSASLQQGGPSFDWKKHWNFPNPPPKEVARALGGKGPGQDTVGAVVRDREGRFAMALSTGGTAITLYGRVGDVPIFGAGGYAGPAGAVACTGDGELVVKEMLARRVYDEIASGVSARLAVHRAVADFPAEGTVGIIAVDRVGYAVAANRTMAYGMASDGAAEPMEDDER